MNAPTIWTTPDGSVSLQPERGRLLGMAVGGHEFLWKPESVSAPWNLGGERLWFGPEADWFWKNTEKVDFDNYQVPGGLNPDNWTVTHRAEGSCSMELTLSLICSHSNAFLDLRIERHFNLLPNGAQGIGVQADTMLHIENGTPGQRVDLWSILQLPFGGHVRIPVIGTPSPRNYFDPCPSGEMTEDRGQFSVRIGGSAVFKIGLQPSQVIGRMAYVRSVGASTLVLEREFPVHEGAPYCDSPLDALGSQGDAVQIFNDGGAHGCFGEMEHHSPALICGTGPQSFSESTVTTAQLLDVAQFASWEDEFFTQHRNRQPNNLP